MDLVLITYNGFCAIKPNQTTTIFLFYEKKILTFYKEDSLSHSNLE